MKDMEYDPRKRPISAWGYVGYGILFMLPVVGLVFVLGFSLFSKNVNRRSFARSRLCWVLLFAALLVASVLLAMFTNLSLVTQLARLTRLLHDAQRLLDTL